MTFQPNVQTLAVVAPPRSPSEAAAAVLAVAETLQADLMHGYCVETLRLRIAMEQAFGGSDAIGAWDWKLAYEALEVATVLFLRKFGPTLLARAGSPAAALPLFGKIAALLPTHRAHRSIQPPQRAGSRSGSSRHWQNSKAN